MFFLIQILDMIVYLKWAMRRLIDESLWMDDPTQVVAKEKVIFIVANLTRRLE